MERKEKMENKELGKKGIGERVKREEKEWV